MFPLSNVDTGTGPANSDRAAQKVEQGLLRVGSETADKEADVVEMRRAGPPSLLASNALSS